MASCTYNPGVSSSNPYAVLNVTQQSQSIENNTSVVRWELLIYRPSAIYSSANKAFSVTINGSVVSSGTTTIGGSGTKSIASGTTTISHNADGSKSISFGFSLAFEITWGSTWIGTGKASGSMALTTIARATTPSLSPSSVVLGNSISISLPRASSAFTHTLQHDFYVGSWTTFATGATTSAILTTSASWADRIPNTVSGVGRIRCLTYNGAKLIGEKIVNFTATVSGNILPEIHDISIIEASDGIVGKFNAFVKTKSKLFISISASGTNGSAIKSYTTTVDGKTYFGSSFTTELIGTSGLIGIVVTVTDTRGRTAIKTMDIHVLDYSPPSIKAFSVKRGDSNGAEDEEGTHALIKLNFSVSPVNNLNDNSYKIEYKKHKETEWKLLGTGNGYNVDEVLKSGSVLSTDYSYMMRLTVSDYFTSIEAEDDNIPSGFTLLDINSGGKSIAFLGVSERDPETKALDFKGEMFDLFGTRINNGMAKYTGSGDIAIDPDTTIDELILTDINTPNGEFMYISTVFYIEKSETANRAQTAIPYNSNGSMYHRYYSGGAWTDWRRHVNEDEDTVVKVNENEWYRKYSNGVLEYYFANRKLTSFPNINVGNVWCGFAVKFIDTNYSVSAMRSSGGNASDSLDIMPTYDKRVDQVGIYAHSKSGAMAYNTARIITFDIQCKGFWK